MYSKVESEPKTRGHCLGFTVKHAILKKLLLVYLIDISTRNPKYTYLETYSLFLERNKNNNKDLITTSIQHTLNSLMLIKTNEKQCSMFSVYSQFKRLDIVLESHRCLHYSGMGCLQWCTKILLRGIADFN